MIPITQTDNDNMMKLMIDIEMKLTKNAKQNESIVKKEKRNIHYKIKNILESDKKNSFVIVHKTILLSPSKICNKSRKTQTKCFFLYTIYYNIIYAAKW